ncbi:MAG: NAD(P)-binding domain-containing protein [Bacteroidetes bacterium]|nr:NAD(P)-binding domain-containing protein [Bacteroidota bacterium]
MTIAVIGTGNIGGRLAAVWASNGHRIILGTRDPASEKVRALIAKHPERISAASVLEAAAASSVVLLAVPASTAHAVARELGDVTGKILIDAMNAVFRRPEPYARTSEAIRAASGSDHIVKCFNSVGAENMDDPRYGGQTADMFLCGDHSEDKKVVRTLAEECGFTVYDVGGLEKEPLLENLAALWGSLAMGAGLGRNIAFKVLRR